MNRLKTSVVDVPSDGHRLVHIHGTTEMLVEYASQDVFVASEGKFADERRGLKVFSVRLRSVAVETNPSL